MYVFQIIIQFIVQLCYCITTCCQISVVREHAVVDFKQFSKSFTYSKNNIASK